MEKLFDVLNPIQEKALDEVVTAIVDEFNPLQIFCFSISIKTDALLSCFSEQKVVEKCDYEILTVTDLSGDNEKRMQEFVSNLYKNGSITIVNLLKDDMISAITSKNIYITTILEKGAILYIADGFEIQ